ncbi:MAG: hypothetical protein IPJ88_06395 [Myxococcales bacterium]|nr:MAG: hypothetical protein IPJ88_06395 [Myxococcales bacterium]
MAVRCLFFLLITLSACSSNESDTVSSTAPQTTGHEETESSPSTAVRVIRTTVPIPVPQPAVAREELTEMLQIAWTMVEKAIAIRPPEPPQDTSQDSVKQWAQGPFTDWFEQRKVAVSLAVAALDEVAEAASDKAAKQEERIMIEGAVAAALAGYLFEDTLGGLSGAPIPSEVASDEELLQVYGSTLNNMIRPYAMQAAGSYVFCVQSFAKIAAADWSDWAGYCTQRAMKLQALTKSDLKKGMHQHHLHFGMLKNRASLNNSMKTKKTTR